MWRQYHPLPLPSSTPWRLPSTSYTRRVQKLAAADVGVGRGNWTCRQTGDRLSTDGVRPTKERNNGHRGRATNVTSCNAMWLRHSNPSRSPAKLTGRFAADKPTIGSQLAEMFTHMFSESTEQSVGLGRRSNRDKFVVCTELQWRSKRLSKACFWVPCTRGRSNLATPLLNWRDIWKERLLPGCRCVPSTAMDSYDCPKRPDKCCFKRLHPVHSHTVC